MNRARHNNSIQDRRIIIIAGSNGAGKTTFAREFLPKEAGCLMIEEIESHVKRRDSFAFETTLSGRRYARMIPRWQGMSYRIKLVFLYLKDVEIAVERVRVRVRQGGHSVPEDVIRRRYEAGRKNFQQVYKRLADTWVLYDNSGERPLLLEAGGSQ